MNLCASYPPAVRLVSTEPLHHESGRSLKSPAAPYICLMAATHVPSPLGFIDGCLNLVERVLSSHMPLTKKFIRDGKCRIIGSVTEGFSDTSSVVRDAQNRIVGRTSDRFNTTRTNDGIRSINDSDPGLLLDE